MGAILLTLVGGTGAMAVGHRLGAVNGSLLTRYPRSGAAPVLDTGVVSPAAPPVTSPTVGDPVANRNAWARAQIQTVLDVQVAALLRGDQAAFLAAADPGV